MENTTAAEPQYTYTEMPGDIARVIFGDEESHTLLNIGDVSLYDVLNCTSSNASAVDIRGL